MGIKIVVAALTDVPENLRSLYEQKDGKYVLALEGDVPGFVAAKDLAEANGKIVELRDTNIKLLKGIGAETIEAALTRVAAISGIDTAKLVALKDLDLVAAKAALERVAALEAKGVKSGEDVQAQITAALTAALTPLREELAGEKKARTEAQQRADRALLRQTIGDKYVKAGGKPSALDFIVDRAPFRVVDNAVSAQENKYSADKPGEPMGLDEWLAGAVKEFDFAFEPSKGGGAVGGAGNGSGVHQGGSFKTRDGAEVKTDGITVLA